MKNVGKPIAFIVAILALTLFLVSIFGVYTSYGDVSNTVVTGASESIFGLGFDSQANITLKPTFTDEEKTSLTDEELLQAKQVFERRLEWFILPEVQVYTDAQNSKVMISTAWNPDTASYAPTDIVDMLTTRGLFEVRMGNNIDDSGNPTGVTENVILTSEHVSSAEPVVNDTLGLAMFYTYEVEIRLTAEGRRLLKDAIAELETLNESAQYITVWIDGVRESVIALSAIESNGKFNLTNTDYDSNTITKVALLIESGPLPAAFSSESSSYVPTPAFGEDTTLALLIGAVVALGVLFIFLIFRYRLVGVAGIFGLFGFIGGTMAFVTGFVGNINRPQNLSVAAVGALVVSLFFSVYLIIRDAELIKRDLERDKSSSKAVADAIKTNSWNSVRIFLMLAAFGLIIFGLFVRGGSFLSAITGFFGFSNTSMFQAFGLLLMAGSLFGLLFSVFGFRLMVSSLTGFKKLKNPVWFGGVDNDEE